MLFAILSYIPAAVSVALIALLVIFRKKSKENTLFFLLSSIICLFILSQFFAATSVDNGLFFVRAGSMMTNVLAYLMVIFAIHFTGRSISGTSVLALSILPVFFSVLTFSDLIIKSVQTVDNSFTTEVGSMYTLQTVFLVAYFAVALYVLFNKYSRSVGNARSMLGLMIVGFAAPVVVNFVTNFIFIDNAKIQFLSPLSLLILSGTIAYAIAKHGLFDIRLVVARSLGYVLSIATVMALYALSTFIIMSYVFDNSVSNELVLTFSIFSVVTALMFPPLKKFFDRITNRIFYQDAYDAQAFLAEVNRVVVSSVDVDILLKSVSEIIVRNLKTDFAVFNVYKTAYLSDRVIGDKNKVFKQEEIKEVNTLVKSNKRRIVTLVGMSDDDVDGRNVLQKHNIEIAAKLNPFSEHNSSGYGLLLIGGKKSGNQFNGQDLAIIRIVVGELSIALQNALRFEEIEKFNVTLQEKVNEATRKLRHTNEKLEAMDETKDEFISMASHQLRTPLTSVKGYVSMVLEGDAGELNEMQRKLLEQAFTSSQRMVFLIADLLNLSRLRTGKFIIETAPTNLADVIEGEVDQLKETAKSRSLELKFKKPKKFSSLMLDETKIRQVIMNFVDNAIYYTPAGGVIEIRLVETDKSVEFTVRDNGIGVPKAEQHHLFNKFYRARNAQKARPDGTGLGLFMAKKVIVAQGGAIIFNSSEGKGSIFGFSFAKEKLLAPVINNE